MPGGTDYVVHDINENNIIIGKIKFAGHVRVSESMSVDGFGGRSSVSTEALIRLACMDDCVSVCNIDLKLDGTTENVANVIRAAMASQRVNHEDTHANANGEAVPKIDFLFIDHDKDSYLPDLQILERAGMVRSGTTVVADNIIFAKISDYMSYVKHLSEHC